MSPRMPVTLDGTYHGPQTPYDGFTHDSSSLLDDSTLFATSFDLQDDVQTLPGFQAGDRSPGFELGRFESSVQVSRITSNQLTFLGSDLIVLFRSIPARRPSHRTSL